MAHFAEINENNIVTRVVVVNNDILLDNNNNEVEELGVDFLESLYGHRNWVQTSYNRNNGGDFAAPNHIYDSENNRFYKQSPYPSWSLDENFKWQPPTPFPEIIDENGEYKNFIWNEDLLSWVEITVDPDEVCEECP
jgi:hypothetical protein